MRLLPILLAGSAAVAQSAPRIACAVCASDEICLDRRSIVAPLPKNLLPDETVVVRVIHKSPFEKIVFKAEFAEVENTGDAVFEKLFRLVAGLALALPPVILETKGVVTEKSAPPPREALRNGELENLVALLESGQSKLRMQTNEIMDQFRAENSRLRKFRNQTHENECDVTKFRDSLDARITAVKAELRRELPESSGTRLLADRLSGIVKTTSALALQLTDSDVKRIGSVLKAQRELEADREALREAQDGFSGAVKVLEDVKGTEAKWFEDERRYTAPADRKATVEVSAKPLDGGAVEKLATLSLSWAAPPRVSLSMGVAVSFLAKQEFYTETVRDTSLPLTGTGVFSYRIAGRVTRPVVFPVSLVHIRWLDWNKGKSGFDVALGAGVNPGGDSPTGELLFGGSFRFRKVFLSPVLHLGRQTRLADNYKLLEASPKPGDFAPPTTAGWKPGFAVAISYRLPL